MVALLLSVMARKRQSGDKVATEWRRKMATFLKLLSINLFFSVIQITD
ncbi:hypothetical protein [Xenorhabdus bovienii]|nr:hypothetical protein [Xenorhabdus bovienii]MDE1490556.1 hypothetical protein [Xenorhabdus bovienii]